MNSSYFNNANGSGQLIGRFFRMPRANNIPTGGAGIRLSEGSIVNNNFNYFSDFDNDYDDIYGGKSIEAIKIMLKPNQKHYFIKNVLFLCEKWTEHTDYQIKKNIYFNEDLVIKNNTLSDHILEHYICQVCSDLMYPCVVLYCGHSLCLTCAGKSEENYKCPFCMSEITGFSNNYIVDNFMGLLNINCPNKCEWIGKLNNLKDHINKCDNQFVKCLKCNSEMIYSKFKNHCDNECIMRKIQCQYCKKMGPFNHLNSHEIECDKRIIPCNKCKTKIIYKKKEYHDKCECIYRRIDCNYCFSSIIAFEMKKHKKICNKNIGFCPCCHQYGQKYIILRKNITKHLMNCTNYYKLIDKYFWMNNYIMYLLSATKDLKKIITLPSTFDKLILLINFKENNSTAFNFKQIVNINFL